MTVPAFAIGLRPGEHRKPCPFCQKKRRDDALGIHVRRDGSGFAHCFRCNYVETWGEEGRRYEGRDVPLPNRPKRTIDDPSGFYEKTRQLSDVAVDYLGHRNCCIPPADSDLRWHPDLKHPCGYSGPALVALVTDAETNQPLTLHFTWITRSGKAGIDKPRLLLAGHRKAGGVIRLWPDESVTTGLAIGEGIETCLAGASIYTPVWATVDAGNLKSFPVLGGIESLFVFVDHDTAGLKAAEEVAERWMEAGKEVVRAIPDMPGKDVCDVLGALS